MGKYFPNNNWSGRPALVRIDNFLAANDFLPAPFSIEWEGKFYAPRTGLYILGTNSDDGSQVFLDGKLVVDNGGHHSDRYRENRLQLSEGLHDIRIRYFQDDGGRKFELFWTPPGGVRELMPVSYLFPPGHHPSQEELARATQPLPAAPAPPPATLQNINLTSAAIFGGPGLFREPRGVAVDAKGSIFVADTGNRRVHRLDPNGNLVKSWGKEGKADGEFQEPFAVVVNSQGEVLVLDAVAADVQKFNADGRFLERWILQGLYRPRGMSIDKQDNLYVADTGGNRVVKVAPGGQIIGTYGGQGNGPGQFDQPTDVTVDEAGNMWVADTMNQRIQALSAEGRYRAEGQMNKAGTFNGPHLVQARDAVFVTEPDKGQIAVFSRDAVLAAQLGAVGSKPGEMNQPAGIATDAQGNLYVAEAANHRIQKFEIK